jgi:hypothetical protein
MVAGNYTIHCSVFLKEDFLVEMGRSIKKLNGFIRLVSVDRKLNLGGLYA